MGLRKVLPAARREGLRSVRSDEANLRHAGAGSNDAADEGDGNAGNAPGKTGRRRRGEKQLIIFAAVERLREGCSGVDGQGISIELSVDAGFVAKVREVGGEAVAQVDGRGCQRMAGEPETLRQTGLGEEMRVECIPERGRYAKFPKRVQRGAMRDASAGKFVQLGEAGGSTAEPSGDVKQVSGFCARTKERFAGRDSAGKDDVGDGDGRLGEIATGQWGIVGVGEGEEPVEETVEPSAGELAGQTEGKKGG